MPAPCFFCLVFGEKLALKSTTCYNRSMICLPQYLQGLPSRGQPFRLPQSTCTTAFLISFVSLVLTLLLTEPCSAESRSNYDAHQITASLNQSVQQHATHAMHRSYDSRYDAYHRLDEVTVSSPRVRWLPSLRFDLQIQVLVVIPNYDAQPNSAPETCRLLAQNEMSQYRAYFVPGATDPWGLETLTKHLFEAQRSNMGQWLRRRRGGCCPQKKPLLRSGISGSHTICRWLFLL